MRRIELKDLVVTRRKHRKYLTINIENREIDRDDEENNIKTEDDDSNDPRRRKQEWSPSILHCHFDGPLAQCPSRDVKGYASKIPVLPTLLWRYLVRSNGLRSEGIFRKEPNGTQRDAIRDEIVQNRFRGCDDPHICASIIKVWLRSLRPRLLHSMGTSAVTFRDGSSSLRTCAAAVSQIKKNDGVLAHEVFLWILDRMLDITDNQSANLMTPQAMATIFAMALAAPIEHDKEESQEASILSASLATKMVQTRELQFAVRDFLERALEWRAKNGRVAWNDDVDNVHASNAVDRKCASPLETKANTQNITPERVRPVLLTPSDSSSSSSSPQRQRATPRRRNIRSANIDNKILLNKLAESSLSAKVNDEDAASTDGIVTTTTTTTTPGKNGTDRLRVPEFKTPSGMSKTKKSNTPHAHIPELDHFKKQTPLPSARISAFVSRGDPEWIRDEDTAACTGCGATFTTLRRKHHCRTCGKIFCKLCAPKTKHAKDGVVRRICATCRSVSPAYAGLQKTSLTEVLTNAVGEITTSAHTPLSSMTTTTTSPPSNKVVCGSFVFDGQLDVSTVMSLQQFLNSSREIGELKAIVVNGDFRESDTTRYAFNDETNKALHDFLHVIEADDKDRFKTTHELVRGLQAYLSRRNSWAKGRRASLLRTVDSSEMKHLDASCENLGTMATPPPSRATCTMHSLSEEQLSDKTFLELSCGVSSSELLDSSKLSRSRLSWGLRLAEKDSMVGRFRDAFDTYTRHNEVASESAQNQTRLLRAAEEKSNVLWSKLKNAHLAIQEADERREASLALSREENEIELARAIQVHATALENAKTEASQQMASHLLRVRTESEAKLSRTCADLSTQHEREMTEVKQSHAIAWQRESDAMSASHSVALKHHERVIREDMRTAQDAALRDVRVEHEDMLRSMSTDHERVLDEARANLCQTKERAVREIASLRESHVYARREWEQEAKKREDALVRDVEDVCRQRSEEIHKALTVEHLDAMNTLRQEHASQLLAIQAEMDEARQLAENATSKNNSGGGFFGLWKK